MSNVFTKAGVAVPRRAEMSYARIPEHFNVFDSTYANPFENRTLSDPVNLNNLLGVLNDDENVDVIVHAPSVSVRDSKTSCATSARWPRSPTWRCWSSRPHGPPQEAIDDTYDQLTKARIPTVIGAVNAVHPLRKFLDYPRNCAGQ